MSLSIENVQQARANAAEQLAEIESAFNDDRTRLNEKIDKLDNWLWENQEHTPDSVIAEFVALRDSRKELKDRFSAVDTRMKEKMDTREGWLLDMIEKNNLESIRTEHGTAYTQTKTRFNVTDWPNYWSWLAANERFDLLEKRPAQAPLGKMKEEGEDMPPGVNQYSERVVTVRRA